MFLTSWMDSRERVFKWVRIVIYQSVGWGVPFLFMVITTSADRVGFPPGATLYAASSLPSHPLPMSNEFSRSCFVTEQDNDAWILTFFFVPVGVLLLVGLIFFSICLIKLIVIAIRLKKLREVVVPYVRLLFFILIFFIVFTFFIAYNINEAANQSTITDGYSAYLECLSFGTQTVVSECSLSSDVTNFPLVILKGLALSCLGALLFFNFLSWALIKQWYLVFKGIYKLARNTDMQRLKMLLHLIMDTSFQTSSLTNSASLAMSVAAEEQEKDGETEKSEEEAEESESSSESS